MSRPVFVRKLTKTEQAKITHLIRSNEDALIVRRAQMIWLSYQGKKIVEIAEMWGITGATVLRTIQNFNIKGLISLAEGLWRENTASGWFPRRRAGRRAPKIQQPV
jgi:hypothetical protein